MTTIVPGVSAQMHFWHSFGSVPMKMASPVALQLGRSSARFPALTRPPLTASVNDAPEYGVAFSNPSDAMFERKYR